ncbi:hydroxyacylglutathione hydrolase-like protein isoform X2 [Oryx dammah]|uniref:hydroxyacylglutathione hydrolase-like protein isoform X2 n=1 Tax=Oryx dammah TaxID=59534 RepID=UPI001A9B90A8|nr:hydroxyacylglutathione hydrolase-like protein isoform X2 [Oryx dammah]
MKVKVIPVLEDNYMYLVIEERTREAVAVDVAVPKRLLEIVGREGVSLTTVLTTHHHWDHARGNAELARLLPGLVVLGADERICALTRRLAHGEELRFGAIHVRCLLTPGHTLGHMSYFLWEEECLDPPAVFSGTGCPVPTCPTSPCPIPPSLTHPTPQGMHCPWPAAAHAWRAQLSRCTRAWWRPWAPCPPRQVHDDCLLASHGRKWTGEGVGSVSARGRAVRPSTSSLQKVFCGHEHTLGNLEFAQKVEPYNDHVKAKLSWAKRDEDDVPTVPATLGEELLYNPFLRVAEESVREFTGKVAPADVLDVLCRERASFERAAEPLQPQARALLALQWGLLSTPRQK